MKTNNKYENALQALYSGYDGLDIAFKGCVNSELITQLEVAKEEAQETHRPTIIYIGKEKLPVAVAESGGKSCKYRFDTGLDGEIWWVRDSHNSDGWNIHVSVKSAAFAQHGYEGVKRNIYHKLKQMGATIREESISRVDFAMDFLAPDFVLNPFSFVTPATASSSVHSVQNEEVENCYQMSGNRVTGKTIGKMPGRQVIIYDKRREVMQRGKVYWWDIWGLDKDDPKNQVWRVELRAGKKHLKETWNVATFKELEAKIGDIFKATLQSIRLIDTDHEDTNVTRKRLHPLWQKVSNIVLRWFKDSMRGASPSKIIATLRQKKKDDFSQLICGVASSYAYIHGIKLDNINSVIPKITEELKEYIGMNAIKMAKGYKKAKEKYLFYDLETGEVECNNFV